jgi:hypothetical protein
MNRPLVYSTEQRRQQYETLRNAGLSRADYTSAIRRLNQQEMKYRTAQQKKEKAQKEKDKRQAQAQLARALEEAKVRARREKQAKADRKERRKQEEKRKKKEKRKRLELAYTTQIKFNMDNRISQRYELSTASKYFDTDADIKLLEIIVKNSFNGMWVIQVNDENYTINDKTRNKLVESIKRGLAREEANTESDGRVVTEIVKAEYINVVALDPKYKYRKRGPGFFKYHSKTNIDLSRYGIWSETVVSNYDDTCLLVALRNGGLSVKKQEIIKRMIKNRLIPLCDIPKICDAAEIQIKIKTEDVKNDNRRIFGKEYEEAYHIGCLIEHYFIIEPVEYTSYSIKNYNELKDLPNFNQIHKKLNNTYARDKTRYINSFNLIKLMLQDTNTFFTEITMEDKLIASTQFYDKVSEEITHLDYNKEKCIRPIKPIKANESVKFQNVFFDFETNPNGEHKPYLCRTYDGASSREFIGENCGLQMLFSLKKHTRLIAHNATYDFRFLINYLRNVSELARGNKLISAKGRFNDFDIEIKDSYHLITMPLRNFPKVFGIENTIKEVMPYTLYTDDNISKRYVPISEALSLLPNDEQVQFIQNLHRWSLITGEKDELYDIIKYSSYYCEIDCKILYQGYTTFRKWIKETFKLDIDNILTGASLAHQYFVNEGCYEGVNELGGVPQYFIQGCVVGGRVMCAENKKIRLNDVVNDFDAVSLYPSAMFRMDGFLKGVPKVIENLDYNWIKEQDGYFIDIVVSSVGIHRKFPLMSYKNADGVRVFTNDMIGRTIRVDKYTLEDIIKFQNITFDVVRGYYFNEGYNTKVRDVIMTIFNKRLDAKKAKNPVEMVYKLIMNSGYGKSIMKPVETESRFFDTYDGDHEFQVYLTRNYNWITSFVKFGNKIKVNTVKTLIDHFNIAQVGVCILSNSKRIMNEVMCLAEDNNIDLYYQDTDSMHLKNEHIPMLSSIFKKTYGRELIGKGLGQFHSDFDLPGCTDVVATKSIFLGKKCYIDKLEGINAKGEKENGFHIRMKGIPEKCIHYVVEQSSKYKDVMDLYEDLYNGNEVVFDLTNGGSKANFKFNKNYTINTLALFKRSVKF